MSTHHTPYPFAAFFTQPHDNEFDLRVLLHFLLKGLQCPRNIFGVYIFESIGTNDLFCLKIQYMSYGWRHERDDAVCIGEDHAVKRISDETPVELFALLDLFLRFLPVSYIAAYRHITDLYSFGIVNTGDGMQEEFFFAFIVRVGNFSLPESILCQLSVHFIPGAFAKIILYQVSER